MCSGDIMTISVIIPAFNEERFLPQTLKHLHRATEYLGTAPDRHIEIIVVDNASSDRTAEIALAAGTRVISVPERNIAKVRNAGAHAASGDLLVFLDADTLIPEILLRRIGQVKEEPDCLGGAVDTDYQPARTLIRAYLRLWRLIGLSFGMAQGALQFCRRDAFSALRGYDETIYMGEDVDFYWRLCKLAKARGQHIRLLRDVQVVPSCRRFDQWSTLRTLIKTNPLYITFFRRYRSAWRGWYRDVPR
jgi:glycosyltransferase involved in cell wall biosynthesis